MVVIILVVTFVFMTFFIDLGYNHYTVVLMVLTDLGCSLCGCDGLD